MEFCSGMGSLSPTQTNLGILVYSMYISVYLRSLTTKGAIHRAGVFWMSYCSALHGKLSNRTMSALTLAADSIM